MMQKGALPKNVLQQVIEEKLLPVVSQDNNDPQN